VTNKSAGIFRKTITSNFIAGNFQPQEGVNYLILKKITLSGYCRIN
jgi:hypothetical protein